ncbi:hypothetical protein G9A89_013690 [Geosiphon pyriformis]|nr:hypothetical protein G9A89_013690 [Geosiphon pyriformis]
MAESESIGANHLGFAKSLFQHYLESAFNFYINEKIVYLLGTLVNTESVKKTFYHKLIQNTSLSTNHNFASIITEINKEIEHHTQQRYPIIYSNFGIANPWEPTESEKEQEEEEEEEESEDQEFTYQNPITENLDIETSEFQAQQN